MPKTVSTPWASSSPISASPRVGTAGSVDTLAPQDRSRQAGRAALAGDAQRIRLKGLHPAAGCFHCCPGLGKPRHRDHVAWRGRQHVEAEAVAVPEFLRVALD